MIKELYSHGRVDCKTAWLSDGGGGVHEGGVSKRLLSIRRGEPVMDGKISQCLNYDIRI